MKRIVLAGVSAVALTIAGAGLGYAADANSQSGNSSMSAGSTAAGQQNAPRDEVRQVQQKLKDDGIYKGQVDGIDGPETTQALEQFQQKNGLKQTGQLDHDTLAKLGINGSAMSGSSTPPGNASGSSGSNSHK
jgi:peptidoglycan hydrolase-like protein with peptidoglycan-binding domain